MTRLQHAARWIGQGFLYAGFAVALGIFSNWQMYQHLPAGHAVIKVSIVHQGTRLKPCVEQTPEELASLPPNMRVATRCPRERAPLLLELDMDGQALLRRAAPPSGLSSDGSAAIYQRLIVPAGPHRIGVRLRDSARTQGFDYEQAASVVLAPAQILVVDFASRQREITLR